MSANSHSDLLVCSSALIALLGCLTFYYFRFEILPFLALAALLGVLVAPIFEARNRIEIVVIIVGYAAFLYLRKDLLDFSLAVGDASAYTWDGIRTVEKQVDEGFFPPLTSAISAVSYSIFGMQQIAMTQVIVALASVYVLYSVTALITKDRRAAFVVAVFYALQPLSVWFSKTTFSETSWQFLILLCVFCLQLTTKERIVWATTLLAGLLALSNFSRGSAPFLFMPALITLLSLDGISVRNKLWSGAAVSAVFLASLGVMLFLREPYLIGWQYSRLFKSISSLHVLAIVGLAVILALTALPIISARMSRTSYLKAVVAAFFGFKIVSAVGFSLLGKGATFALLLGDELTFSVENFGYLGTGLAVIGIAVLVRRAIGGNVGALMLIGAYCISAAPFNLQHVAANQPHELALYWSRYFYSDLFVVYVIALGVSVASVVQVFSTIIFGNRTLGSRNLSFSAITLTLLSLNNWSLLRFVSSNGYLDGSSTIFNFIHDASIGVPTVIFSSSGLRYGPYDSAFLLSNSSVLATTVRSIIPVDDGMPTIATPSATLTRVICVNLDKCDDVPGLERVSSISQSIGWDHQTGDYRKFEHKQTFWNLVAYDYCVPLKEGSEMRIGRNSARCLHRAHVLGRGWYNVESNIVWSSDRAELTVTVPECAQLDCSLLLNLSAFAASVERPVTVEARSLAGTTVGRFDDALTQSMEVKLPRATSATVALSVEGASSPQSLGISSDNRVLGVALSSLAIRASEK